ncbi:heme d1 biosynthesis radical SAM protein NirJ [Pseudomonas brenneri]|nr:heme d1 biosynthesis radical SAM protein NirJ [Pseudomonas brenneri]
MLRISHYLRTLAGQCPPPRSAKPGSQRAPVVIWNLLRRCNLTCKHCYATSADSVFRDELDTEAALKVIDDLHEAGVKVLILSGGEPLLREDLFQLSAYARRKGFFVALSSNGTLIDEGNIQQIAAARFDYVGISIDGLKATHDAFRQCEGSFERSMHAINLCRQAGIRVGLRTTLTQENYAQLPQLLALMREYDVQKFYLSHLNYSGRGKRSRQLDAHQQMSRDAMLMLFQQAWDDIQNGVASDFVSGNNDADAVLLLQWVHQHLPEHYPQLEHLLHAWGGNASGSGIANIDNTGEVHPDTYWWQHSVGNVRHTSFREIWLERPDPLLLRLRQYPREIGGRCTDCRWLGICNGNTRTRAWAGGDLWGPDPGCYLSDAEIARTPPTLIPCSAR